MIRSNFAITRLLVLPFGALLLLYLLVVGGGGAWLYLEVRTVETRLRIDELVRAIKPLAEKLENTDALASMQRNEPWLLVAVKTLFDNIPALRSVSVRGAAGGFEIKGTTDTGFASQSTAALPAHSRNTHSYESATQRLHDETDLLFQLSFDLTDEPRLPVRLDFGFDRLLLLERIDDGLSQIKQTVVGFIMLGGSSIILALLITLFAMRTTRRIEGHFQEIYQRASMTETAAALVHDLRNPLTALRVNVKALQVLPKETDEIVEELDRDIVTLNDKLTNFLNLTRRHDVDFASVAIDELVNDAVRLAEPIIDEHGLSVDVKITPGLPKIKVQKAALRDALLNLILNACQSGQEQGSIYVKVQTTDDGLEISVADQGNGIDTQDLPRLFEAFYSTRPDGNGLGLAVVQRVAAAHQGSVRAENRPSGGARIVLTLPLQTKEIPHWWNKLSKNSPA